MIDALGGPSLVAEMTGRRGRVVRRSNGRLHYELRGDETSGLESVNNAEVTTSCTVCTVIVCTYLEVAA